MNQTIRPLDPSPWPPNAPVDLKSFVTNLALHRAGHDQATTTGQYRRTCVLTEHQPKKIEADPSPVLGFLDGVQRRRVVCRIEHRETTLVWLAAGAVLGRRLLNLEATLAAVTSVRDEETIRRAGADVPVVALPELAPWDLALATDAWIDQSRRGLELKAIEAAPAADNHVVVVDGALPPTTSRVDVVGVVKGALETEWLTDPTLLPTHAGWRSPALILPAVRSGELERLTAFVRLRDADGTRCWGFSLIRVEVPSERGIEALDAAAAMAVSQRQSLHSPDPRAEIQLAGMYRAEQVLKAQAPAVVKLLQ